MADITRDQLAAALEDRGIEIEHEQSLYVGTVTDPHALAEALLAEIARTPKPGRPGPHYYDGKGGMQPFDVIDAFGLDFYEGNVVKYIVRWRKKNGLEDLRKARTYLNRIIDRAEQDAT